MATDQAGRVLQRARTPTAVGSRLLSSAARLCRSGCQHARHPGETANVPRDKKNPGEWHRQSCRHSSWHQDCAAGASRGSPAPAPLGRRAPARAGPTPPCPWASGRVLEMLRRHWGGEGESLDPQEAEPRGRRRPEPSLCLVPRQPQPRCGGFLATLDSGHREKPLVTAPDSAQHHSVPPPSALWGPPLRSGSSTDSEAAAAAVPAEPDGDFLLGGDGTGRWQGQGCVREQGHGGGRGAGRTPISSEQS